MPQKLKDINDPNKKDQLKQDTIRVKNWFVIWLLVSIYMHLNYLFETSKMAYVKEARYSFTWVYFVIISSRIKSITKKNTWEYLKSWIIILPPFLWISQNTIGICNFLKKLWSFRVVSILIWMIPDNQRDLSLTSLRKLQHINFVGACVMVVSQKRGLDAALQLQTRIKDIHFFDLPN